MDDDGRCMILMVHVCACHLLKFSNFPLIFVYKENDVLPKTSRCASNYRRDCSSGLDLGSSFGVFAKR